MSGPKHLWSGDWESESARTADDLADTHTPVYATEPEAEPEPQAARTRRWSRRQIAIALTTGVAAAAVAVGLVTAFNDSNHKPTAHKQAAARTPEKHPTGGGGLTTPAQPCNQTAVGCSQTTASAPMTGGPYADWIGMQIVTSPSGVVVDTVRPGSLADQEGFEPGDQIMSVNTHVIGAVSELRDDTKALKLGSKVTVAVLRQSVQLTFASIPLAERPTIHP